MRAWTRCLSRTLLYPNLDGEYITSVSPTVITGLLREQMGFDGVVFSDDMRMQGAAQPVLRGTGLSAAYTRGRRRGTHRQISRSPEGGCSTALIAAVKDGTISRERLEESVYRILSMKVEYIGF